MPFSTAFDNPDLVTYGTGAPTGTAPEGAEYFETSDGTATGNVIAVYTYDSEDNQWVKHPTGGSTCPAPMTRAALRSLRTAGNLSKDCHYVITDYSRGTVGAATILLHAVDSNTLSQAVEVKTSFDTLAWEGRYDIDTNRLLELNDNIGNNVSGQENVDTFPWGDTSVYDNVVQEGGVLNYTDGNFSDNVIMSGANVTVNNPTTAALRRNTFNQDSNTTLLSGDFIENTVANDATVTVNTTGGVDNNTFGPLSVVNITGGNVDTNEVGQSANLTVRGGNLSDNTIKRDATVTVERGNVYENNFGESVIYTQRIDGGNFYQNNLTRNSTVVQGPVNMYVNEFSAASVNTTGSRGNILYVKFLDSFSNTTMQNITTLDLAYVTVSNNSQINATGATRVYLRYVTLENFGRLLVSSTRQLDANYTGVRDYAYIQVTNGRLYANHSSVSNVSYIQHASSGTNRVDRLHVTTNSRARFLNTVNNCRIYYSNISSGSFIEHRGSSTGCYFYYCDVSSSSQMYANNSVNLRGYYMSASGNSQFYSQNVTGTHYAYYNTMNGHGYIRFYNSTGGRIYAVSCHGQGLVNFYGATAAGRLYYSSFTAYYYLNAANWTVTRQSLHGYGRRSYTVTNPATNGTFTQNF